MTAVRVRTKELGESAFEHEAAEVLAQLRQAFSTVIANAKVNIEKAADVKRAFGLDNKVAWQVYRVAHAPNPLQAGAHVPGPATMRKLLKTMAKWNMRDTVIAEFERACAAFEELVKNHAGNRAVFDSMIANWAGEGDAHIDLERRREAYRSNSHIYGISAKALLSCSILQPTSKPEHGDLVLFRGYFDLVRLRPGTSCILTRFSTREMENMDPTGGRTPIDADAEIEFGGPVLPEYSTPAPHELQVIEKRPGVFITRLCGNCVGRRDAQTYVFGELIRDLHVPPDGDVVLYPSTGIRLPLQTVVVDLLVPSSHYGPLKPSSSIWGDTSGESGLLENPWEARDLANQLPMPNPTSYLGKGSSVLHTEFHPRYKQMVQDVCAKMGWDVEAFDVYRTRIQFPVLNSFLITEFRKAQTGSAAGM